VTDVRLGDKENRIDLRSGQGGPIAGRRRDAEGRRTPGSEVRRQRLASTFARDRDADGLFWCSVETTRVYCRPSCPSRHARPENIRFHDTLAQARATGFRPCGRCRPDEPSIHDANRARIDAACQAIVATEGAAPSTSDLAAASGFSRSYFHRLFKEMTGMSPHAFARDRAVRLSRCSGV
jgi:AraC family transcriptional regulator, regulatory protein of adaptative response / methylated-DNA-[protein]-cysteine methyltransferase